MSLKVRLLLGAAAPLMLALPAVAQVSITTATTSPVNTSNAGTGGVAANVEVTSTGSIVPANGANQTIVTVDSSNSFTNTGSITLTDSDNSVGVRLLPGFNNSYTQAGTINLIETYTRTDTDDDDDLDGSFALGTNRFGIMVNPGGTMNGSIDLQGGSIVVEGNNSGGVSIQSALNGNYRQKAAVSVIGDNAIGVDIREDVTGNVALGGSTSVQGQGSRAVRVLGDIAGEFMVDGSIVSTGFTSTSVSNWVDPDFLEPGDPTTAEILDPEDLLVGSTALEIRGDLTRGFLINGAASGPVDPTPDVKDVVQNYNENRTVGTVTSYGSAPAVLIQPLDGGAGSELRLGLVRESVRDTLDDDDDKDFAEIIGTFDYTHGFINRGTVNGNGLNVGFVATGMRVAGSADGTHQTIIDGGIFNTGTITANSYEANATGFSFGSGASTPLLLNNGNISAAVNTETTHDAVALQIDAGASLPQLTNNGIITANVRGYDGDAIALRDLSGTLTTVRNNSRIAAGYSDDDLQDDITSGAGRAIALDLSHSASGVTLTQQDAVDNARIFGDVLFGVGADRADLLSGEVFGDIDFGSSGADVLNMNSSKVAGDITFRGATAQALLNNGAVINGALAMGAGAGTISLAANSIYNGAVSSTGTVGVTVNNSTFNNSADGTLNVTTMDLANNARVGFVIDNARIAGNTPVFNVGTANVAANTIFTPIFEEFSNQAFTLRVLNATTLNLGGPVAAMLNTESPYLFNVALTQPNANALDLTFSVKTVEQLGLNTRQAGAYAAILDLAEENSDVGSAIASLPNAAQFLRGWNDLLPGQDAEIMKVLASNATAAFGATAHRLDLISDKPDAPGGAWAEEFGVYHDSDATADRLGASGGGFGVAAGVDLLSTGTALVGAFTALESLEIEEKARGRSPLNVSQSTLGLYGGWRAGNFAANGTASIGFTRFQSDRTIEVSSLSDRVRAEWNGQTYNAAARLSYAQPLGFLEVRPYVAADYIGFKQDGYREIATSDDLEIIAGDAEATLATASYGLHIAANFSSDDAYTLRPEVRVGQRHVLEWDATPALLQFGGASTGTTFSLDPGGEPEDALVAGLGFNIDSQFLNLKLGYDVEMGDTFTTHYGSITLRMAFW